MTAKKEKLLMGNQKLLFIEELKIRSNKCQRVSSPDAGLIINRYGLKALLFLESRLGIFTEPRAREHAQS
jgi:hypothetical protein